MSVGYVPKSYRVKRDFDPDGIPVYAVYKIVPDTGPIRVGSWATPQIAAAWARAYAADDQRDKRIAAKAARSGQLT